MTRPRTLLAVLLPLALTLPLLPTTAQAASAVLGAQTAGAAGAATPGGRFHPLTPTRLLDTRSSGTPVSASTDKAVVVTGVGGVHPTACRRWTTAFLSVIDLTRPTCRPGNTPARPTSSSSA